MKTSIIALVFAVLLCVAAGCASRDGTQAEPPKSGKPMSKAQERAIGHGEPHSGGTAPQGYGRP
ncbi:MAG: hypothetical protein FWH34_01680 [Desulfovibrionaceae bacterium]|nr:hypothetical protein [Desulfovibrionaceae bacterium]